MVGARERVKRMKVEDRLRWIVRQCRRKNVLDVGCVGEATQYNHPEWLHGLIRKHAKSILGIDYNMEGIKRLQKAGYNVKFSDAENFSLSCKFDIIVASELIEHLSNPGLFLKCARSHLRGGDD
jgi:2-polyprenyl-3-methyl-5-hydroxy-6-metoxy-1,4-benzoquinol methylase